MYVRQATRDDVSLLVRLSRQTFFEAFSTDNDPDDMEQYLNEAFSPERIQAELLAIESIFLLICPNPNNQPTGYAHLVGNSIESCITGKDPVELVRLYINKDVIGQGYGSKLMQACLERANQEGFETIWLGVWEKNYRAQRFYERWGFRQVGSHDFPIGKDIQTDFILTRPVKINGVIG